MTLSIIIPVYNVEKFIHKCLQSIVNQNLSDAEYEVIIVNDGTKDNSQTIIDKFTQLHRNFRSFITENNGPSAARNFGVKKAKGDYIFFIDSDDYLIENTLPTLLDTAKKHTSDLISFGFQLVNEDEKTLTTVYNKSSGDVQYCEDFINEHTIIANVWRYFFKREIIINNGIEFIKGIYHEDESFTCTYISFCKTIVNLNLVVYNYLQRANSIISTKDTAQVIKKINDLLIVCSSLKDLIHRSNISKKMKVGLSKKHEQLLVSVFLRMKKDKLEKSEVNSLIGIMRAKGDYPIIIKHSNYKFKLASFFINSHLFCKLYFR